METGIIFDLDGTLWDATEQMLPAWNRVMARYSDREPMTLPELRSYMGKTVEEIAAAALPALPEEQRVEVFNRCSIEELPWLREHPGTLYPDVPQVLRTLCKRYPLYIVSNCQDGYIQTFLEVSGLGDCFAGFTCSGMTGHGKGENLKMIVQKHGISARCISATPRATATPAGLRGSPSSTPPTAWGRWTVKFHTSSGLPTCWS